jgi:hypothetical protein
MPYIAMRRFEAAGPVEYQPGDVVPDVEEWPTFAAMEDLRWIQWVPDERLEERQAEVRKLYGVVPANGQGKAPAKRKPRTRAPAKAAVAQKGAG